MQLPGKLKLVFYTRTGTTSSIETVLSSLANQGVKLTEICRVDADKISCVVPLLDLAKVRNAVRGQKIGFRVRRRIGLAFVPAFMWRHLFFMIGAGLFVGVLMVLHMIVWQVEVVGETRLSHTHILQVAKQEGLFRGQWKGRLPQSDVLAVKLESQLPQAAWIGLKFIGSHAYIQVVDRTVPPAVTPQVNRNLVATHDAMVTEISAMKGTPVVRPNDHVTRGTVLISGLVGDAEHHVAVAADGIVRGLVWYTQTVVVPTETSLTRMTGPHQDKTYLHVFGRDWKLKGYRQTPYKHQKVVREFAPPRIFGFKLPIPIIKQRAWKVETIRSKRNLLQASRVAMADADQNMLRSIGKDAQIRQRKLLHENLRDGKVYIKVHVEVEQEIMRESELIDQSFKR